MDTVSIFILIGFLALAIIYYVFPETNAAWWLIPLGIFTGTIFMVTQRNRVVKIMGPSILALVLMNTLMNGYFYPELNKYQSGKLTADWINENNIDHKQFHFLTSTTTIRFSIPKKSLSLYQ